MEETNRPTARETAELAPVATARWGRFNWTSRLVAELVRDTEHDEAAVLAAVDEVERDFRYCSQPSNADYRFYVERSLERAAR